MGKTFTGMVHPDPHPIATQDGYVKRVHMFEIPTPLREHAHYALNELPGDEWRTVGEFRYEGESCHETAVARRVMRDGRMVVEYGIEVA